MNETEFYTQVVAKLGNIQEYIQGIGLLLLAVIILLMFKD